MKQEPDTMKQAKQLITGRRNFLGHFCRGGGINSLSGGFAVRPGIRNGCGPGECSSECSSRTDIECGDSEAQTRSAEAGSGEGICGGRAR